MVTIPEVVIDGIFAGAHLILGFEKLASLQTDDHLVGAAQLLDAHHPTTALGCEHLPEPGPISQRLVTNEYLIFEPWCKQIITRDLIIILVKVIELLCGHQCSPTDMFSNFLILKVFKIRVVHLMSLFSIDRLLI